MRKPAELKADYVIHSGNWEKWISEVQKEAYDQALSDLNDEIGKTSLQVEVKEIIDQIIKILKK